MTRPWSAAGFLDRLARKLAVMFLLALTLASGAPVHALSIQLSPDSLPLNPGGPYAIGRDKAVGTVLATATSTVSASGLNGTCLITALLLSGSPASGGIFSTGVNGLGVKLYYYDGATRKQITPGLQLSLNVTLNSPGEVTRVEAELLVTGPIGAGSMNSLPNVTLTFAALGLGCGLLDLTAGTLFVTASNPSVIPVTCTVLNPAIAVSLPQVSAQTLSSGGMTAGDTRFDIPLSCATGANVFVTLTDATSPANTSSLLTLKNTSTAQNIRVEILREDGSSIAYGPDSAGAGTTNQWHVGSSALVENIPLIARYRSVGSAMPGSVEAAATFTMSYQ